MAANKYETHVKPKLVQVQAWARNGLNESIIAKKLGVAYSTFRVYKSKYSALSAALKKGREVVDFEVENAMLKIALGYSKTEEQALKCKSVFYNEKGKRCETEKVEIVEVEKYYPPNFNAQKHWLNNRKKDEWKNDPHKTEIDKEALEIRKKELEARLF